MTTPRTAGNVSAGTFKTGHNGETSASAPDARGKQIRGYGLQTDKNNNVISWSSETPDRQSSTPKTNQDSLEHSVLRSKPRRGRVDDQDRLWFANMRQRPSRCSTRRINRSGNGKLSDAVERSPYDCLRQQGRQGSMDRPIDDDRCAPQPEDRRDRGVSSCALDQYQARGSSRNTGATARWLWVGNKPRRSIIASSFANESCQRGRSVSEKRRAPVFTLPKPTTSTPASTHRDDIDRIERADLVRRDGADEIESGRR